MLGPAAGEAEAVSHSEESVATNHNQKNSFLHSAENNGGTTQKAKKVAQTEPSKEKGVTLSPTGEWSEKCASGEEKGQKGSTDISSTTPSRSSCKQNASQDSTNVKNKSIAIKEFRQEKEIKRQLAGATSKTLANYAIRRDVDFKNSSNSKRSLEALQDQSYSTSERARPAVKPKLAAKPRIVPGGLKSLTQTASGSTQTQTLSEDQMDSCCPYDDTYATGIDKQHTLKTLREVIPQDEAPVPGYNSMQGSNKSCMKTGTALCEGDSDYERFDAANS